MLSVITQPLHRLKLHTVNFMQTKNRHKQKDIRLKVPETKHTMEITDDQYCVYIILSCGSMDKVTILNVRGGTTRAPSHVNA